MKSAQAETLPYPLPQPAAPLPAVQDQEPTSLMEVIARASRDPSVDVDKLERLLGMAERLEARQAKQAYSTALAEMQPKLPVIEERGEINRPKLGWLLKKNANRIVGGYEFQQAEADGRTAWRLMAVKSPPPPPLPPSPPFTPPVEKTVTPQQTEVEVEI